MAAIFSCDIAIVGGGLAGALIALVLARRRPELDVRLIEAGGRIGGNHLWSHFPDDVRADHQWIVAPLVAHAWRAHDVRFPGQVRTIDQGYRTISSDRLDEVVRAAIAPERLMTRRKALTVEPRSVLLADGDRVDARGVIDARGPGDLSALECGWQKFVGREWALAEPHGRDRPIVMDATVEQIDGYRFVYTLPIEATRMFVEDTYYSDSPTLDPTALAGRCDAYLAAQGWQGERLVREEAGVLPVVTGGDFERYWQSGGGKVAKAGTRAGLFHPLTSYSLPDAVATAALVGEARDLSSAALHDLLHDHAKRVWQARGFYRLLGRMLFRAAEPEQRWRIFQRFYGLDAGLIARFYSARSTFADQFRVLAGKPPVPVGRAIAAMVGR